MILKNNNWEGNILEYLDAGRPKQRLSICYVPFRAFVNRILLFKYGNVKNGEYVFRFWIGLLPTLLPIYWKPKQKKIIYSWIENSNHIMWFAFISCDLLSEKYKAVRKKILLLNSRWIPLWGNKNTFIYWFNIFLTTIFSGFALSTISSMTNFY